jgi:hypothetical protein
MGMPESLSTQYKLLSSAISYNFPTFPFADYIFMAVELGKLQAPACMSLISCAEGYIVPA